MLLAMAAAYRPPESFFAGSRRIGEASHPGPQTFRMDIDDPEAGVLSENAWDDDVAFDALVLFCHISPELIDPRGVI